jgi:hypothetical protein
VKLLEQVRLEYRQGTSDKVYEVDLCEVGPDRCVVNFRYGRRGTPLRDGSKTPAAVSRAAAKAIYDKVVASKRNEGYVDFGTSGAPAARQPTTTATPAPAGQPPAPQGRAEAVLRRLQQGLANEGRARGKKPWRLSRAIWRAGELRLGEAEPVLLQLLDEALKNRAQRARKPQKGQFDNDEVVRLLGSRSVRVPKWAGGRTISPVDFLPPEDLLLYTLAWSLGQCGSATSAPALRALQFQSWEPVGRIATAALLLLVEDSERERLTEQLAARLPSSLASLCRTGPAAAFETALDNHLGQEHGSPTEVLDALYLIDNLHVRPVLLQVLRRVPVQSAYFQSLRHIFKVAEMRRDAEVFGIIAHCFETAPRGGTNFQAHVDVMERWREQVRTTSTGIVPFNEKTRRYLRFRTWRTLRRFALQGDAEYVRLAVGVLLAFTDNDAHAPDNWYEAEYTQQRWGWMRSGSKKHNRDAFGKYWAFNQVLYHNSPRYRPAGRRGFFTCVAPFKPGGKEPAQREEAFPELWTAAPEQLVRLLTLSRCEVVHRFAVKALKDRPDFCQQMPVTSLAGMFAAPYEVTLDFALGLAVQRYNPNQPDHDLVLALANAALDRARAQARQWIEQQRAHFTQDLAFLAALVCSPIADTRLFARELLRRTTFPAAQVQALIARVVAALHSLGPADGERARDAGQTLQLVFASTMRAIGVAIILDLLAHPLAEVRKFGAELVLEHQAFAQRPPEDLLLKLLADDDAGVRGVGVRLLGQLPEATLKASIDLLVGLTRHELVDFRNNVRPLVKSLAASDKEFGRRFAERLAEALLVPGAPEGVPSHTVRVLREDLGDCLDRIQPGTVWILLRARSGQAQEIGGLLLSTNVKPQDLSLDEIVKLASHDILSVREAAWQMARASLDRMKKDMDTASRLVDAKWEDSRQFAFGLLRDAFGPGELTPTILVSFCDSVRPDVQAFGKEMITRLFAESDGPEYALKLSEHTSPSMQMFAANFLERYAGDSPERLVALTHYFQSVLSRVNQGRVAKERVFAFLEQAAQASEDSARVVAGILARQSATIAIGDQARAIEALTRIQAAYPNVPMPLKVRPVEVRDGV